MMVPTRLWEPLAFPPGLPRRDKAVRGPGLPGAGGGGGQGC